MKYYRDPDGDLWAELPNGRMAVVDRVGDLPGGTLGQARLLVEEKWGPLTEVYPAVESDEHRRRREYGEVSGGFVGSVLMNAPESWDGDESAEHIALSYIATLEARLDEAGISREKHA